MSVVPPAFVRWGEAHRFSVFGDRSARDRDALAGENLGYAAVAQGHARVLLADELADLGADRGRGGARSVVAFDLTGEEIAQLEHPARGVHVLARGHARDG